MYGTVDSSEFVKTYLKHCSQSFFQVIQLMMVTPCLIQQKENVSDMELAAVAFSFYLDQLVISLTLSDAGGGVKCPPSHTFAIPRKKSMGKVANFF